MEYLRSKAAKRAFVKTLLSELPIDDQKDVLRSLSSLTLKYDIVARLPIELAQRILLFIDSDVLVFIRAVSKNWLAILSDESFCGQLCRERFYVSSPVRGSNGPASTWNETFLKEAAKRHALAHGRPWAKASYDNLMVKMVFLLTYSNGRMAWLDEDVVVILDLISGRKKTHMNASRAKILDLRMSERWLVGLEGRQCWALCPESDEVSNFRIPSAHYRIWDAFEDTIILSCPNAPGTRESSDIARCNRLAFTPDCHKHTIVWNPKSQKSHEITIEWPERTKYVAFGPVSSDPSCLSLVLEIDYSVWLGNVLNDGVITLDRILQPLDSYHVNFDREEKRSTASQVNSLTPAMPELARKALFSSPSFYRFAWIVDVDGSMPMAQKHRSKLLSMLASGEKYDKANQIPSSTLPQSDDGDLMGKFRMQDNTRHVTTDVVYEYPDKPVENDAACRVHRLMDGRVVVDAEDVYNYELPKPDVDLDNLIFQTVQAHKIWADTEMLVFAAPDRRQPVLDVFYFDRDLEVPPEVEDRAYRARREKKMQIRLRMIRERRRERTCQMNLMQDMRWQKVSEAGAGPLV